MRFAGFEVVVGGDGERLRRRHGKSIEVLGVAGEATAGAQKSGGGALRDSQRHPDGFARRATGRRNCRDGGLVGSETQKRQYRRVLVAASPVPGTLSRRALRQQ